MQRERKGGGQGGGKEREDGGGEREREIVDWTRVRGWGERRERKKGRAIE